MITYQLPRVVFVTLSLVALVCTPVWSQEPEADPVDKWDGELVWEGGVTEDIIFNVRRDNGSYKFLSVEYVGQDHPVENFSWIQDPISFTWKLGSHKTNCVLHKQDETEYVGDCKFSDSDESLSLSVFPKVKSEKVEEPIE